MVCCFWFVFTESKGKRFFVVRVWFFDFLIGFFDFCGLVVVVVWQVCGGVSRE
jgi:hypothetical protein